MDARSALPGTRHLARHREPAARHGTPDRIVRGHRSGGRARRSHPQRRWLAPGRSRRTRRVESGGLLIAMQRVLSTHLFVNHRLTTVWLDKIHQAGIPAVEIFCARQHLDYRDRAQINELGHWFRDSELKLHSLHSPMYSDEIWGRSGPNTHINITDRNKADRIQWVGEIKRAIEIA